MYNISLMRIVTMNLPLYNEYTRIKVYNKKATVRLGRGGQDPVGLSRQSGLWLFFCVSRSCERF
jgi:hypothetical protein